MAKIKVYGASKLIHASFWRQFALDVADSVDFVSRWPFYHVDNIPDTPYFAKVFWQQDHEDVQKADVVLVYAEVGEHLKGALVEAGIAIGLGKQVIVVGDHPFYGTWQYHPLVHRVPHLDDAKTLLLCMGY